MADAQVEKRREWYQEEADDIRVLIGDVIRKHRRATGKSVLAMQTEHGLPAASLTRMEAGISSVTLETYAKVAEAFDMTLKELLIEALKCDQA